MTRCIGRIKLFSSLKIFYNVDDFVEHDLSNGYTLLIEGQKRHAGTLKFWNPVSRSNII